MTCEAGRRRSSPFAADRQVRTLTLTPSTLLKARYGGPRTQLLFQQVVGECTTGSAAHKATLKAAQGGQATELANGTTLRLSLTAVTGTIAKCALGATMHS